MAHVEELAETDIRELILTIPFKKFAQLGYLSYDRDASRLRFAPMLWPIRRRSASTMPAASPRPSASSTKPVADHIGSSSGQGRLFSSTFKIETASSHPTKAASLSK